MQQAGVQPCTPPSPLSSVLVPAHTLQSSVICRAHSAWHSAVVVLLLLAMIVEQSALVSVEQLRAGGTGGEGLGLHSGHPASTDKAQQGTQDEWMRKAEG